MEAAWTAADAAPVPAAPPAAVALITVPVWRVSFPAPVCCDAVPSARVAAAGSTAAGAPTAAAGTVPPAAPVAFFPCSVDVPNSDEDELFRPAWAVAESAAAVIRAQSAGDASEPAHNTPRPGVTHQSKGGQGAGKGSSEATPLPSHLISEALEIRRCLCGDPAGSRRWPAQSPAWPWPATGRPGRTGP